MSELKKRTWGTIANTVIFWAGVACILPWIWTADSRWGWTGLAFGGAALLWAFGQAVARKTHEQKEQKHTTTFNLAKQEWQRRGGDDDD